MYLVQVWSTDCSSMNISNHYSNYPISRKIDLLFKKKKKEKRTILVAKRDLISGRNIYTRRAKKI